MSKRGKRNQFAAAKPAFQSVSSGRASPEQFRAAREAGGRLFTGRLRNHHSPTGETLRSVLKKFPDAVWMYDGDRKLFLRTEDLAVASKAWQDRVREELGWAFEKRQIGALDHLLDFPAIFHGANLYLTSPGGGAESWFLRLLSTGQDANGTEYDSLGELIVKHRVEEFEDRNVGNVDPSDDHILARTASGMELLLAEYTAMDNGFAPAGEIRRLLFRQPVELREGHIFGVDPRDGTRYYILSLTGAVALAKDTLPFVPPKDPAGFRSDWSLIKWLHQRYGRRTSEAWANLDLVDMRPIRDDIGAIGPLKMAELVPALDYRPWRDVLFDFGWLEADGQNTSLETLDPLTGKPIIRPLGPEQIRLICRITDGRTLADRIPTYSPWLRRQPGEPAAFSDLDKQQIVVEAQTYVESTGVWMIPFVVVYERDHWWGSGPRVLIEDAPYANEQYKKSWGDTSLYMCGWGVQALAFLAQMPHILVQKRSKERSERERRLNAKGEKPWARTDRPTVLPIRPEEIPLPKPSSRSDGEPERSRFIRKRRGGWMVLKHPRYYRYPHSERYVEGKPALTFPPLLKTSVYETDDYRCGGDEMSELRAFRRDGSVWRELHVRRVYRKEFEWTGPREGYEAQDGHIYRVLTRENDTERSDA